MGTLHPIVFHLMVFHFLQQVDPPVLPCLHEYVSVFLFSKLGLLLFTIKKVFGIDNVPLVLSDDLYDDFFRVCNAYVNEWKSTNMTSVEMLFLQLLSYM